MVTELGLLVNAPAGVTPDYREVDVAAEVKKLTGGGADITIEALGTQQTFESASLP